MDQRALVGVQIDDGQRLIEQLGKEGVEVTVAAWIKESETGDRFLYIVTPLVSPEGDTRSAYRRVIAAIREMHKDGFWFDALEVKVIAPSEPVAKALLSVRDRRNGTTAIHLPGGRLGHLATEEVYIYPPPP